MKPKEQRIAIAKACGWLVNDDGVTGISPINVEQGLTNHKICSWKLPDYLNDLNAMYEAEKVLLISSFMWETYSEILATISDCNEYEPIAANAMQRAKALLKTIGKWKGDNQ
jgi:hypothetical protein